SIITIIFLGITIVQRKSFEEDEFIVAETAPANFYFYVENEDGTIFTNHSIIDQFITTPEILKEASESTNTNLYEIVETTDNTALVSYTNSGETSIIQATKNTNSNLHEVRINVGNDEKNLEIARFYFSLLF